ncbi:Nuclease harbi1-like protein [Camponotus japonicus]
MDEGLFDEILIRITPHIQKKDTVMRQAINPRQRLAATLRFLASGNSYKDLSYAVRIAPNTLSVVVFNTLKAIVFELQNECIKCPNSKEEWAEIEAEFRILWQFPHCIGALDGKHINFRPSRQSGSFYRNYKGTDSIILMALTRC